MPWARDLVPRKARLSELAAEKPTTPVRGYRPRVSPRCPTFVQRIAPAVIALGYYDEDPHAATPDGTASQRDARRARAT
jgi:hypothetical protein